MAVDPTIVVAGVTAGSGLLGVLVKGVLDIRQIKYQTNGALQKPLQEIRESVSDLAAEIRDVKADVRELKRRES